jgi:gluconate 2-dehydrogenase gamma chain
MLAAAVTLVCAGNGATYPPRNAAARKLRLSHRTELDIFMRRAADGLEQLVEPSNNELDTGLAAKEKPFKEPLKEPWELSQPETDTLIALMDRIIPADDYPAASKAGVLNYIRRIMATDLRSSCEWYRSGLEMLNKEALTLHGCAFTILSSDLQDELIALLEKKQTSCDWPIPSSEFIRLSVNLVSEGYYADPANGGNLNAVSWGMIGFSIAEGIRLPVELAG